MAAKVDNEEEVAALSNAVDEYTLDTWLTRAEEWARNELAAAGLQTVYLEPTPDGGQISVLDSVQDRQHSSEWFAAHVLRFAERTRYYIDTNNAKDAVWNAIHLVEAIRLSDFKMDYEQPLGTGIKVREGARESWRDSRSERARRVERWQRMAEEIGERHPLWSDDEIIRHILKDEPRKKNGKPWSRSTILRAIKKSVKAGD